MASQPIYQFYAELNDYKPKIWRRFQVAGNITMARLGYIIMTMYEMQASHLFCFDYPFEKYFMASMLKDFNEIYIKKTLEGTDFLRSEDKNWHFEILSEETIDSGHNVCEKLFDATEITLSRVGFNPNEAMTFTYDYGDNWEISVTLKEIIIDKELPGKELPRVLDGEGYGIIEDCGGVPGLNNITKTFKKKRGSQYKEYFQWLDCEDLDLLTFDIDDMNFRLKKVPRIYADAYEYGLEPTKRSIDLIGRKYKKQSN